MSGDAGDGEGSEGSEGSAGSEDDGIGDPEPSLAPPRDRLDSDAGPWPLRKLSAGEGEPPRAIQALGDLGIYLGVIAVGLAIVGLVAGTLEFLPLARVAIFFAIVLGSVAMVLGVVFQIFAVRA